MSEQVKPATDAEIDEFVCGAWDSRANCVHCGSVGSNGECAESCPTVVYPRISARIESDRAIIAELLAACKVAYFHITDIMGPLGEHRDNPVPTQLRDAIAKAESR